MLQTGTQAEEFCDTIPSMRNIPTCIAIGTQKAASTYLYNLLKSHPDVSLSEFTEVNFYSSNFEKGTGWYAETFFGSGTQIDISPKYFMYGENVAKRIKDTLGTKEPRLLLILRNPIEYVNSHFRMQWQQGFFKNNPQYPDATEDLGAFISRYPAYAERGKYHHILTKNWLSVFPQDHIKVVFFEELTDPNQTDRILAEIQSFWELPARPMTVDATSKNRALRSPLLHKLKNIVIAHPRLKETLKKQVWFNKLYQNVLTVQSSHSLTEHDRKVLKEIFANDVASLKVLLNTDIACWEDFR